jgi:hypothetical protein
MITNNNTEITGLDFQTIKQNLKTFLSSQTTLKDYNFDGSALSIILDVLAYNTHYNAVYTNFAFNEMFLDSASKRSSLVSIANNFGYLPTSAKSAMAKVNLKATNISSNITLLIIPKLSSFTTKIGNDQFIFYTLEDYISEKLYDYSGHSYFQFDNMKIFEGVLNTITFICTSPLEKFSIPFNNVDTSSLRVLVSENAKTAQQVSYTLAKNVTELSDTSAIFYLKEIEGEKYELSFGENNLGIPIAVGNVITLTCLSTSKEAGNNATGFTFVNNLISGTFTTSLVQNSLGGAPIETIEELRYNTSKRFFDQDRAITAEDFKNIIKRYYDEAESISIWGGETNSPPSYGKIFISIKPKNALYLTSSEEAYINEIILKPRSIATLNVEFVKPAYVELDVNTTVYYNKNMTQRSANSIAFAVRTIINEYSDTELKKFDGVFRLSKLTSLIDSVDSAIESNITRIKLLIPIDPNINAKSNYYFNIGNPIFYSGIAGQSLISNGFYIDESTTIYYLEDNGAGVIRLFTIIQGGKKKYITLPNSTIDYTKGIINISSLLITRLVGLDLTLTIKPKSFDVIPYKHQILFVKNSTVTVLENTISNYKFASSQN